MTAIAKSAKRHPAAKKCCGWEEPAICNPLQTYPVLIMVRISCSKGR